MSSEHGNVTDVPSPWNLFLAELNARLPEPITLHCIGGFVVSVLYGLPRPTGDVDYVPPFPTTGYKSSRLLRGEGPNWKRSSRFVFNTSR